MRKRVLCIMLCIIEALILCACGGNVKNVKKVEVESEKYTNEEIDSAIDTIKQRFISKWKGCTLTQIEYAGDETSADYQEWASRNKAVNVIVFTSSFDVDSSGGDGSLNPNTTYKNWKWILVRKSGENWMYVDGGLG